MSKEIRSLTGLRGVAAIYVVLFHFFLGKHYSLATRFVGNGYLAVDLFFILSGFVMAMTYGQSFAIPSWRQYGHFLGKRLGRIYPLYFLACLLAAAEVAGGILEFRKHAPFGPTLITDLLLLQNWLGLASINPATWSLSTEWAAYVLFPLLALPRLWSSKIAWVVVPVVCSVMAGLAFHDHIGHAYGPFELADVSSTMLRCIGEFTLGMWIRTVWTRQLQPSVRWAERLQLGILATLLLSLCFEHVALLSVLCFALLVGGLSADRGPIGRFLSTKPCHVLGELSYSLYLLHPLTYPLIASVHRYVGRHGMQHGQTYGAVCAVAALIVATPLSYKYIEVPGRDLVRSWLHEPRPAAPPADGRLIS